MALTQKVNEKSLYCVVAKNEIVRLKNLSPRLIPMHLYPYRLFMMSMAKALP